MRKFNSLAEVDETEVKLPFIGLVDDKENGIYKSFIIDDEIGDRGILKVDSSTNNITVISSYPKSNEIWIYAGSDHRATANVHDSASIVDSEYYEKSGRTVYKLNRDLRFDVDLQKQSVGTAYRGSLGLLSRVYRNYNWREILDIYEVRIPKIETDDIYSHTTTLGDSAFNECSAKSIIIPDNITYLDDSVFSRCENLTSIKLPQNITSIPQYCFSGCKSLQTIDSPSKVNIIGWDAFNGCISLTSIEIPNNVTHIGESAFSDCINLKHINIPNIITSLSDNMFDSCISLTSIDNILDNIQTIGRNTFEKCYSLTYIDTNKVTAIDDEAFANCKRLHTAIITANTLGNNIFKGCFMLKNIIILNNSIPSFDIEDDETPTLGFENISEKRVNIYVPDTLIDNYKNDADWNRYSGFILPLSSYEDAERYTSRLN